MHDGAEQEGPLRGYARDDHFGFGVPPPTGIAGRWDQAKNSVSPPKKNVKVSIEVTGQESRNELYVGAT